MMRANQISVEAPNGKVLIQNISIEVEPGQLKAIIGKNGAGKSTLLKAMTQDINAISGTCTLDDTDIQQYRLEELAQKRSIVSQQVSLEFSFSVRQVVLIGRSPYMSFFETDTDDKIATEALKKVDALHLIDRSYLTLSGGEKQRVQFARAIAQIWDLMEAGEPSYLLLDEPLSSLDISHQHEMMTVLKELSKKNVGILIIIHDLNLAAQYSDKVHVLKDGETVIEGDPALVFTEKIISEAFDYPVNILKHPNGGFPVVVTAG